MFVDRNIGAYVIYKEETILAALNKITANKSRAIFAIDERGLLEGSFTDGDFRRWVTRQSDIDLNRSVAEACNIEVQSAGADADRLELQRLFGHGIELVPLLDDAGHVVAIAHRGKAVLEIGSRLISDEAPAFTIAEIGINHNGSLDLAKRMIDEAVGAGADCAKFQMRTMSALYQEDAGADAIGEDLGSQYVLGLLERFQLTPDEMVAAFEHCRKAGIQPLCTPWDLESLTVLEDYGMEAYKVASADLTNHDLLTAIVRTGKPAIVSTGMSREQEIVETVNLLKSQGASYALLHCNSTYPAPFRDIRLNYLARLKEIGDCPVGYSGHERGYHVALAAVARGARIVEKHFTLDKGMEGNDHKVSLLPAEFRAMVEGIRQIEESIGEDGERMLSQGELMNRENLAKSLIAARDIAEGETIAEDAVKVRSPGKGLQPNQRHRLVGRAAPRAMSKGDFFFPSDLSDDRVKPRAYRFQRPWGLPVRYHDLGILPPLSNPDFVEFHFSFKDLEQDPARFFETPLDMDYTVHSPDLFAGDHLLNLASEDDAYLERSLAELQRVIDVTRALTRFFRPNERPLIIASVGGFSKEAALPREDCPRLYQRVIDSLARLDDSDVEIIPQTLPPFPWYLGGQLYCNLFVDAEDIVEFCQASGRRVCFDVSHSKLAANYAGMSFGRFVNLVAPHTAHLHIVDAEGVDGEGIQIGEGEIDFAELATQLGELAPRAGFIPEIWQGHKRDGEGFWIALDRLEKWF